MPRPGAARRPAQLSVTQIEAWRRNPYAIYARHILRLKALDPLDQDPGAADLGNAVHKALHAFTERFPHALPAMRWRCCALTAKRRSSHGSTGRMSGRSGSRVSSASPPGGWAWSARGGRRSMTAYRYGDEKANWRCQDLRRPSR